MQVPKHKTFKFYGTGKHTHKPDYKTSEEAVRGPDLRKRRERGRSEEWRKHVWICFHLSVGERSIVLFLILLILSLVTLSIFSSLPFTQLTFFHLCLLHFPVSFHFVSSFFTLFSSLCVYFSSSIFPCLSCHLFFPSASSPLMSRSFPLSHLSSPPPPPLSPSPSCQNLFSSFDLSLSLPLSFYPGVISSVRTAAMGWASHTD